MLIVTEQTCQEVVGRPEAFEAVEQVFAAMARGDAYKSFVDEVKAKVGVEVFSAVVDQAKVDLGPQKPVPGAGRPPMPPGKTVQQVEKGPQVTKTKKILYPPDKKVSPRAAPRTGK